MYVIIVGGGRVGYHLADHLIKGGHEVFIIERDAHKCDLIAEQLGHIVLKGDGSEPRILQEAGARRADVLIAVTGNDEDNLAACLVAKHLFGVGRTIALANNPQNERLFHQLGVDAAVSATGILMAQIEEELPTRGHVELVSLKGNWEVAEIEVPEASRVVGKRLQELEADIPQQVILVAVVGRDGRLRRAEPTTLIQAYDRVIALTPSEEAEALVELFTEAG